MPVIASRSIVMSAMQLRNARVLMGWSRDRLAPLIGTSTCTLAKLEKGEQPGFETTLQQARTIFEAAGLEFTDDGPPGLRLRMPLGQSACEQVL